MFFLPYRHVTCRVRPDDFCRKSRLLRGAATIFRTAGQPAGHPKLIVIPSLHVCGRVRPDGFCRKPRLLRGAATIFRTAGQPATHPIQMS